MKNSVEEEKMVLRGVALFRRNLVLQKGLHGRVGGEGEGGGAGGWVCARLHSEQEEVCCTAQKTLSLAVAGFATKRAAKNENTPIGYVMVWQDEVGRGD